jgi:hypothetical protein
MNNLIPTDRFAVCGAIDPDVTAAGTVTTGWIAASAFAKFAAIVMAGTLGANATIDAKIEQATDAAGTGAKDVTGKAITQLTQAGTDQSEKQALINIDCEDLDVTEGFDHIRLSITVGTATSDVGGMVLGFDPRYGPASDYDAASVDEIVT